MGPSVKPGIPPSATRLTASGRGQRRAARLAVEVEGTLVGRVSHPVRLVDLSASGCLLRCAALLDAGAILELRLQIASHPFAAKARVVDSSLDGSAGADGTGSLTSLEFLGLAARDEAALRRFLEEERRRRRSADAPAE